MKKEKRKLICLLTYYIYCFYFDDKMKIVKFDIYFYKIDTMICYYICYYIYNYTIYKI